MNERYAYDARVEARQDLLAHPERAWPHAERSAQLVAGVAYAETHPHRVVEPAEPDQVREEPPRVATFAGKYLSLTSYRRDGTGVATPVWFVQEGARLLVETDADSYKVRRIRRNPSVTIASCTATGRIRGEPVAARAELLADTEIDRVQRLMADKYRFDLIFVRPIRALLAMLHRGRPQPKLVIVAITPS